ALILFFSGRRNNQQNFHRDPPPVSGRRPEFPLLERGQQRIASIQLRRGHQRQALEAALRIERSAHDHITGIHCRRNIRPYPHKGPRGRDGTGAPGKTVLQNPAFRKPNLQIHGVNQFAAELAPAPWIRIRRRRAEYDDGEITILGEGEARKSRESEPESRGPDTLSLDLPPEPAAAA